MKKLTAFLLTLAVLVTSFVIAPVTASAETQDVSIVFGKEYTGEISQPTGIFAYMTTNYNNYNFTMTQSAEVLVTVKSADTDVQWSLSSGYSNKITRRSAPSSESAYLTKGETYTVKVSGTGKYSLVVTKKAPGVVKFSSSSGKMEDRPKAVGFNFTGNQEYARDNLSISSSNPKVATAEFDVSSGTNAGSVIIIPQYIGKAVISLKLAGSNTAKYTIYVTKGYWGVAKGSKAKAPKPKGIKNVKWKSSKKKVVTINKKTGKIKAKKGGRSTLTAKKGKVSFKINTVVTDYIKLGKKTYKEIKNVVNNPEKLKVYNAYKGYSKVIYTNGRKIPVVVIDYGSTNENGAMVRNKICAYYDDVYEPKYKGGWDTENIIGKKNLKIRKIK